VNHWPANLGATGTPVNIRAAPVNQCALTDADMSGFALAYPFMTQRIFSKLNFSATWMINVDQDKRQSFIIIYQYIRLRISDLWITSGWSEKYFHLHRMLAFCR
jgi:hypothetical protein